MLLRNCRYLVTQNAARDILERVDVLIEDNCIKEVGKGLARRFPKEESVDCSERIVMPGLINAHTHLGMSGMRGFSDDKELAAWLAEIIEAEHARDHKQILAEATLGVKECIRLGTTCCCDMYSPGDVAAEAAAKSGMRLVNCPAFFTAHHALSANDIVKHLPVKRYPSIISMALGPHSIYGTDEGFLKATRAFATEHKMIIHIHVAETRKERVECKERTGLLPVEYLDSIGFLGPDVLIAHAVWLTKGELDILAARGVKVVHCPQSNMKLAGGGVMPLAEMHERGIVVALGTDSAASNNSLDMFREMHTAALLHKHHYWDATAAPAQTVLDMATRDGARALGLSDVGSIEPGKLADVILLDTTDINLQPLAKERIVSHLVYSASGLNVSEVIVDGKLLIRDKKFPIR
ncbi:TPA: amidohydrolase [Candidatus Woesearchaeota archaeon]|nr:amidohydrolase [Candidatus Woesearchaeota archaeon]